MTTIVDDMTAPRVIPRGLQPSEHRALLTAGDACAATAAVVVALWLWSIPAGYAFSTDFVTGHAWWFLAAVFWLVAASIPAAPSSIAFSLRRTLAALARGAGILLVAYGAWYFYAHGVLPRLVVLYFLWEATLLTLAWRLIFVTVFSRQRFRQRAIIVGSGRGAALALSTIRFHRARQVDVVGFVPEQGPVEPSLDVPRIDGSRLLETAAERGASELVLALNRPAAEGRGL